MLTGDSERTAAAIAAQVGVDEYRSEVLPEDKAHFVEEERAKGRTVVMLGDGINDSPALSAARCGHRRQRRRRHRPGDRGHYDCPLTTCASWSVCARLSSELMKRIHANYRFVHRLQRRTDRLGRLRASYPRRPPHCSTMLSTLGISLHSMTNLLEKTNH